jgi:hypothetical protein
VDADHSDGATRLPDLGCAPVTYYLALGRLVPLASHKAAITPLIQAIGFFFALRKCGDLTRVKSTTSSPVTVLMS